MTALASYCALGAAVALAVAATTACGDTPESEGDTGGGDTSTGGSGGNGAGGAGAGGAGAGGAGAGGGAGKALGPFDLLKDINPGSVTGTSSSPHGFTAMGGKVFFAADDHTSIYNKLWTTDGTREGTRMVSNLSHGYSNIEELNGKLIFTGHDASGAELWSSDGTEAGTKLLKDILPGGMGSNPHRIGRTADQVFFSADDGVHGREVWVTNGTEVGTRMIRDINPGIAYQDGTLRGIAWGGKFYFYGYDAVRHNQLWVSDGTEAGTQILTPPAPPYYGTVLVDYHLIVFQNKLFFTYDTPGIGIELWVSDGTPAGTTLFKNLQPEASGASARNGWPREFTLLGDKLLFFAHAPVGGDETLWSSDGTPAGTVEISRVQHAPTERDMRPVGGKLVFNGRPSGTVPTPLTLWVTDGTPAGTFSLANVASLSDQSFTPLGDKLIFFGGVWGTTNGINGVYNIEVWSTDATTAGTQLVKEIVPGPASAFVTGATLTSLGAKAYFGAQIAANDYHLFESDGTTAGTKVIAPANATEMFSPFGTKGLTATRTTGNVPPFVYGNTLLMSASYAGIGQELYRLAPSAL